MLAAAALLALSGGLALPATAQAQAQVLVSNIDMADGSSASLATHDHAQGFTTGRNAAGYRLTSIEVEIQTPPSGGGQVTARVMTESSGRPSTVHATLIPRASIVAGGNFFDAPVGTTLAGNRTKYFVVVESTNRSGRVRAVTADGQGPATTDWSIDDVRRQRPATNTNWTSSVVAVVQSLRIRINGLTEESAPPVLTAAEVKTDGHSIVLTFGKNLDHPTYTTTIRSAFTVTVDGTDTSVQSTSGGMDKVNLSVSNTIGEGQTVVVSYDQSDAGTEALGDSDGNKVADFTTGRDGIPAVVNNAEMDLSPPELTRVTVTSAGVAIELAFDEDLDLPATIPAALKDAFSVTADGTDVDISSLAADGSSGLQINLSSRILKD